MSRRIAARTVAPLLAALAVAITTAHADGLVGRFRMVEQRYGAGQANLADGDEPLMLTIARAGSTTSVTLRAGGATAAPLAWPAFLTDAGPLAIEMLDRTADASGGAIHARYRVRPSDDLTLEISEHYALADGGRFLVGTYTVSFRRLDPEEGEEPRGSYVLHRRFEREP